VRCRWQQHEIGKLLLAARVDGEVDAVERRHLGNLVRGALVQVQLHVRVLAAEIADHARQHIACLRVRGANGQRAAIGLLEILGKGLQRLRFAQHAQRAGGDFLSGRREALERPPVAHEKSQTQLLFEEPDLLADARLRGVQRLGGSGDIEAVLDDGREITELLQLQGKPLSCSIPFFVS
jgi:hypothetical protein